MRLKAWMKLAEAVAITTSQTSARFAPAPAAVPFTAAITGTGQSTIDMSMGMYSSRRVRSRLMLPTLARSPRSCPEQKARPSPVRTTTRASRPAVPTAWVISARICVLSAFMTSGRRIVMMAKPLSSSRVIVS